MKGPCTAKTVYKNILLVLILLLGSAYCVSAQCSLSVSLSATNNKTICSGNSVIITATATGGTPAYTYVWSTGETTPSISVNKGSTYTVSVSDKTSGCQPVMQSITITEAPIPSAPTAADVIVCKNSNATLHATAPGGLYQWYDINGAPVGTGDTYITTSPITAPTTYYVETTLGGCTSARTAVNVLLNAPPTVSGAQICAGNQATLSAAGGDSYTWYTTPTPIGPGISTSNPFVTPQLVATTTYYVVAHINGCDSEPTPVTVTVTPYPSSPVVVPTPPICSGDVANLHAQFTGVIDWFDSPTSTTSLITSPDYTTPPLTATTTYYVQNSSNGCASPRVPVTVTVNPIPAVPIVIGVAICTGTKATLTPAAPPPGSTYNWYADEGDTFLATGDTYQTPALNATTTYYVQTVNGGGCVSTFTPVTVSVAPTLPAPAATTTPVCPGTPATLTATTPADSFNWYNVPAGGTPLNTGPGTNTFTTSALTTNTTYYVEALVSGCVSPRAAVTATVLASPAAPTASGTAICTNSSTSLTATGGAGNYEWYDAPTGGTLLYAGSTYITPVLNTNTTYYVQTTSSSGCESTRTPVTVSMSPVPPQPTVSGTATICPGSTAALTASVPPGGTVNWYTVSSGGIWLASGITYNPVVLNTTTFYAENVIAGCASARSPVTVSTVPIAFPQFKYASATYCKTSTNVIPTTNDPAGGTYSSSPAGLIFVSNTTGEINMPATAIGKYTITFIGNESCHGVTQAVINIVNTPDASFTYSSGSYCQFASPNPAPVFTATSTAGNFTATPAGLVFSTSSPGVIDLQASSPGTYTIINTIAANGTCIQATATQTITINQGVTVNAGPDQAIPGGTTAQLNGTITGSTGGTWTTNGTGTFSNPNLLNAVYIPGATETSATLTLTSNSACGTASDQIIVTFSSKPSAPVAAGQAICYGNTATLTAIAGGSYQWYDVPLGGTPLASTANYTTPNLTADADYYVQTTILGSISDRTQVHVTVNQLTPAPTTSPTAGACLNTAATLTATGSATGNYEWYGTAVGGSLLSSGNGSTFITPPITADISYYVQAIGTGGCPSARVKVDVTALKSPTITSAAKTTICSGTLLNYTIASDINTAVYTWKRDAVAGISNLAVADHPSGVISETLINTGTTFVNVVYIITATSNGCTTTFPYTVRVNPAASVTSPPTAAICTDYPLNYNITFDKAVTSFSWSRAAVAGISNTALSGQTSTPIQEALHNTTTSFIDVPYTINYMLGSCPGTFNLVVKVSPSASVTSGTVPPTCSGTPFAYTITANVPTATFSWRRDAVAGISNATVANQTSANINETLINTTSGILYTYYIITPFTNGCPSPNFILQVPVKPAVPVPVINSNSPVCEGNSIHLQTPGLNNATYLWSGPNGFTSALQNPEINGITQANAGTYTLVMTVNGCQSPAATTVVAVNHPAIVDAGPNQTICITQTQVNLSGSVSGGTNTGFWKSSGSGYFLPSTGQLNAQYVPTQQDANNGSVILTLTSTSKDDCNPVSASTTITFSPTPSVDAGADQDVCSQNASVQLNGTLLKPGNATWSTSGTGTFAPSATQPNASYAPSAADIQSGQVTLTLTYTNPGICDIPTAKTTLKFIPPPTLNAGGTKYVLSGHTVTLTPTVSDNNVQYLWTPNIFIDNNSIKNPVVTGDVDRTYTLTVTDSRQCVSVDSTFIKVIPHFIINNTFTPNGDGVNDTWPITGIAAYPAAVVDIYDRSGSPVYHSVGYPKPWDGKYNGKPLPAATYYYVIKMNAIIPPLSGPVTIIR